LPPIDGNSSIHLAAFYLMLSDAAVKKPDARAIEKLVETQGLLRKANGLTVQGMAQLQQLISELEARAKAGTVASVPADMKHTPIEWNYIQPRSSLPRQRSCSIGGCR